VRGSEDMDSVVAEFGIACEACHGPGRDHVEANQNPLRRYALHLGDGKDETIVNPKELEPSLSSQVCGQCHGITELKPGLAEQWNERGFAYEPGKNLFAQRNLVTEGAEYFWPDGQVRVSGREYNGLVRSPCFTHGDASRTMSCFSCHAMHKGDDDPRALTDWRVHQLLPDMETDRGCTQCHAQYADPLVATRHTHHAAGPDAPSCYDCHMPRIGWGLLKAVRTHQVTSPTAAESVRTGRPNACNLCHLDETLAWTSRTLGEWYGTPPAELDAEQERVAAGVLWTLTGDACQRALMSWHMGWGPAQAASGADWMAPYLSTLLDDTYDAVRFRSLRSLRTLPGFTVFAGDPVAPAEELRAMRQRAGDTWSALGHALSDGALLLEDGRLQPVPFEQLLQRRDQRRMVLAE